MRSARDQSFHRPLDDRLSVTGVAAAGARRCLVSGSQSPAHWPLRSQLLRSRGCVTAEDFQQLLEEVTHPVLDSEGLLSALSPVPVCPYSHSVDPGPGEGLRRNQVVHRSQQWSGVARATTPFLAVRDTRREPWQVQKYRESRLPAWAPLWSPRAPGGGWPRLTSNCLCRSSLSRRWGAAAGWARSQRPEKPSLPAPTTRRGLPSTSHCRY